MFEIYICLLEYCFCPLASPELKSVSSQVTYEVLWPLGWQLSRFRNRAVGFMNMKLKASIMMHRKTSLEIQSVQSLSLYHSALHTNSKGPIPRLKWRNYPVLKWAIIYTSLLWGCWRAGTAECLEKKARARASESNSIREPASKSVRKRPSSPANDYPLINTDVFPMDNVPFHQHAGTS